jgi:TonB family protein
MPSMSRATISTLVDRCGYRLLLAALAYASSAAALAQAETADAPVAEPAATVAEPATSPDAAPTVETEAAQAAPPSPPEPEDDVVRSERLVESSIAEYGRNDIRTAEAYIGLADAHRNAKDFEGAAENYLLAVEVYRAIDGPFTPLTSLGDSYREAGDNTNAVAMYSEARTVSRRVYGLHNVEQIDLLDRISESLLDLNEPVEAEAQQLEALRLVQRANPAGSDPVLAGIYKYAGWLGERGMYQLERDQYARALRIIREHGGDNDVRQVTPLLGIGNTFRRERNPAGQGISSLQDALMLLRAQREPDAILSAMALRDIGDWNTAFGRVGYDGMEYQRAWQLLGAAPNGEKLRKEWFSGVNYVLYEPISQRGVSMDPDAKPGHVLVRFDIDLGGNPADITLLESDPVGFKDEAVLRHIRRSRFRPWIADGAAARGENVAIRVDFRYLPDALNGDDND